MGFDKVSADNFYKDAGDQIKINWFLYEYANNLYMNIKSSAKLARYKKGHTENNIIAFCVYFAKRLRQSVHDAQIGLTKGCVLHGRYVYEFYPDNSYAQTQSLLEAAILAWDEQLENCAACGNNCLEYGYEITGMFDSLEKTGWPT
jgi:hypothetical protein